MINLYEASTQSFQENLDRLEKAGRKDSPEWHLAKGLLRLAQGLMHDREEQDERLKGFARSAIPHK